MRIFGGSAKELQGSGSPLTAGFKPSEVSQNERCDRVRDDYPKIQFPQAGKSSGGKQ
jgi:hypothetical protein